MKIKHFIFAAVALFAFGACSEAPESPFNPGGGNENGGGATDEGIYINETFANSFGVFSTEETVGNYPWVIDYSTAKATSYVDGANNAATSWLISSPVDFTNETEAYVAFDYIIRYSESGKVAANHSLLISDNYAGDAATATWVDLPYGAVEGADWATFYKANVNIPAEFLGKSGITFALRYSATTKAGTWEVKNFKVAHGTAEVVEPEEAGEYTVAQALAAYTGVAKPAIVKGYIVGSIDDKSINDANFSGNAVLKTNLLIADNADETEVAKCLTVQLPSGKVRDALNLVDNPGNYKKFVTLTGSLEKYFGVAGLKSVTQYSIEGETPEEPETPETPENAYINETFAESLGAFTTQEVIGNYAWFHEVYQDKAYAKVSGYENGASQNAESWLISPAINFTNETAAYIAFDYVINKGNASAAAANHKLVITSNYTGDVATTEWTEVNYGAVNNSNWTFHNTGKIALPESMMGKAAVVIAFKYMSTTSNSSTWEVNNVVVSSGTGNTPETPENPGEEPENPGEEPGTPDTPAAEAGVFDFTNPEGLTPSVERATVEAGATQGAGVEASEYTFTNGNVSVKVAQGSATTAVRFWTRTGGDVELRTYKNSTITVSVSEGTMSSIVFEGGKVSDMTASTGSFSAGTWSGNAQSVTFNVTKTLNIQKLTVK
ncbi:MAG: choice-of-anchor J domain-containing protein [Bacteroidaceae bacterium]|nr:choice-of-anchor J domain-containing protein [Bacteroidaceae bacterium]